MSSNVPSIGRIVHVRIRPPEGTDLVVLRPAIIVRVWEPGTTINAQVFLDGYNDDRSRPIAGEAGRPITGEAGGPPTHQTDGSVVWATSLTEGDGIGQWRWPAR